MVEKKSRPKKSSGSKKRSNDSLHHGVNFAWAHRTELLSGLLVLIGIILAFFYVHVGGFLVGLGFGLCFFEELHNYFVQLRDFYTEQGLFKTLIWIGVVVYLLLSVPAFVIATIIGYAAILLVRWSLRK